LEQTCGEITDRASKKLWILGETFERREEISDSYMQIKEWLRV
jgi:hypothetical protein